LAILAQARRIAVKIEFHRLPGETLEVWQMRLESIEAGDLSDHQQNIRTLCLADNETQMGQAGPAGKPLKKAGGARGTDLLQRFARLWEQAGPEERAQIIRHLRTSRPG
jgi:hypothetical protein